MTRDEQLIERILAGQARALEEILDLYQEKIRRHLVRLVSDGAAAEDLLQETFLRVWNRANQWQGRGSFQAWLYRVATNLALNHLRGQRRRKEQPLESEPPWDPWDEDDDSRVPAWMVDVSSLGPEGAVMLAEERAQVRRLVESLPQDKRQVFRLVHEMEMSVRDVADELNIPEGTVKSRLYYARKSLAQQWRDEA